MASRTDQLHSHQFTRQRVVAALAQHDPYPVTSPQRRLGGALLASVLLAALALAAVGVYGIVRPSGGGAWRDGAAVIIERETGARFVYAGGLLHPVVNYSSALLLLGATRAGGGPAGSVTVARSALAGVARGAALGIPGAPDLLPAAADLVAQPWTVCSRTGGAESVLYVGGVAPGAATELGERGVLASDPAGGLHLLWHGRRYPIEDPELVLAAFAWQRRSALPVAPAVLNAVPPGSRIGRLAVTRGGPSSVEGLAVGQVFVVENATGGRQYGVAQPAGLAEITPAQADLLIADGANGLAGRPVPLSAARYASAPRAASLAPAGDGVPPSAPPELVSSAVLCAAPGTPVRLTLHEAATAAGEMPAASTVASAEAPSGVDFVAVPPGRGAVVEALAGPGAPSGALALVTDQGRRYPVPSAAVLGMLGYGGVTPLRLPAAVVALLPAGPVLDPERAAQPA